MNSQAEARKIQRYLALDIHKEYVMAGAMTAAQEWVIRPGRVEMIHFRKRAALWSAKKAKKGRAVGSS